VHQRLVVLPDELGDVLPPVAALRQVLVRVLHPDDRRAGGPRPVDEDGHVRDHRVAVVRVGDDVVLDVDDEQGGVGAVRQGAHGGLLG
jgi:hypothetical protein